MHSGWKWVVLAVTIGGCCGFLGTVLHVGVEYVTGLRGRHPWLLWCLPLVGLIIVGFYKMTGTEGQGTNDVIDAVNQGSKISIWLLPAVLLGTLLTHLCGGSAGREGAALQMGGDVGNHVGRLFRLDNQDLRVATVCGMAACFSALFGTPLTATMLAIMIGDVGVFYHVALVPGLLASLLAYGISLWMGVAPPQFHITVPDLSFGMTMRVVILALGSALVAILFCNTLHYVREWFQKHVPNAWVRIIIGGMAVIGMTYLCGTWDYNGTGSTVIAAAIEHGTAHPLAFLLKIIFTAVTLGAGFKGGEVVPSFFIGATFGCCFGSWIGIPAGFGAALGLAGVFCGATNCLIVSIFLAVELFGADGLLYFALCSGISYIFSGYSGFYSSQTILYSKLSPKYIHVHTNHHHAGEVCQEKEEPQKKDGTKV